jgi:hypothetical protein
MDRFLEKTLPPLLLSTIQQKEKRPLDFMKWMAALDISEAWGTEKAYRAQGAAETFRTILEALEEPKIRLAIEGLLMTKHSHGDTARMVSSRFLFPMSPLHIELYQKYFFDVNLLKRRDWKVYIDRVTGRRREIYYIALTDDVEHLKVELDLPADISVASTLQYMLSKASIKARTYLNETGPAAGKEARHWVDTVTKIVDKYEKYRTRDAADLSKSLQLEFDYVEETYDEADATLLAEVQSRKDMDKDKDK